MRLRYDQLAASLQKNFAPVYLLYGDEPWQFGQAATSIRQATTAAGFSREVLDQEEITDWSALTEASVSMSLFASRKLIELRLKTRPDKQGGAEIQRYCQHTSPDVVLLILGPALETRDLKTAWATQVEKTGVLVQVWPLKEQEFRGWLAHRLKQLGYHASNEALDLLSACTEGNLLAADQEVSKLALQLPQGKIEAADLLGNLADSARYDIFALGEAALTADRVRVTRILQVLAGEGKADVLVLWALTREIRLLATAALAALQGQTFDTSLTQARIPRMRMASYQQALGRLKLRTLLNLLQECARADLVIKGQQTGDIWHLLAMIADQLAGGVALME